MKVTEASTDSDYAVARGLFELYSASLAIDLAFQRFESELAAIATLYGPPRGALFLAWEDTKAIGCVAIRPLRDDLCEMKRLYVVPEARGRRAGRLLAESAIAKSRELGYRGVRLDTLTSMTSAAALYRSLGFRETAPYYDTPYPTLFFELPLNDGGLS